MVAVVWVISEEERHNEVNLSLGGRANEPGERERKGLTTKKEKLRGAD